MFLGAYDTDILRICGSFAGKYARTANESASASFLLVSLLSSFPQELGFVSRILYLWHCGPRTGVLVMFTVKLKGVTVFAQTQYPALWVLFMTTFPCITPTARLHT
jgi:hypothetical protein